MSINIAEQIGAIDSGDSLGIIVRSYTNAGEMIGTGKVSIDCRELINIDSNVFSYYLVVEVTPGGEYAHPHSSVIPFENVDKMLKAIENLKGTNRNITKFSSFEVEYKTDNDLRIVVFNTANGSLNVLVGSGPAGAYFNSITKLDELRSLILRAKSSIETLRIR